MTNEYIDREILRRIIITVKVFFENNGQISDNNLSIALNSMGLKTSSSTVSRDLTNPKIKELFGNYVYEVILDLRKKNKHNGQIKSSRKR